MKNFVTSLAMVLFLVSHPAGSAQPKGAEQSKISGTVVETMNAASYTYVRVDTGKQKIWAAAPQFQVKVGDKVSFSDAMPMKNYQSKTLKRTFDTVYFAGSIETPGGSSSASKPANPHAGLNPALPEGHPNTGKLPEGHPDPTKTVKPANIDFSGISKPAGGLSVAEVFEKKGKLGNKKVTLRGKVVKFNSEIMNKNWVHVQDGTGGPGANDLTVTTSDKAQVGDTVLVNGTLALNKDFGYGYKYDVVLENAKMTVEKPAKR